MAAGKMLSQRKAEQRMRQNSEATETTSPAAQSHWDVLQEEPHQPERSVAKAILNGWDRFNVRHLLLWMVAIAISIGINRGIKASQNQGIPSLTSFLTAWFSARFDFQDYVTSISAGSILGLGIPAVMTGPAKTNFSEHPARVLLALCISFVILNFAQQVSGVDPLLGMLGVSATGLVWSLYALVRPKIGWAWRIAIFLVCLSCISDFCFGCQLIPLASPRFLSQGAFASYQIYVPATIGAIGNHELISILLGAGFAIMVPVAGILEIAFGRFKDWRTWTVTMLIPICLMLLATPIAVEIVRGYLLEQSIRR